MASTTSNQIDVMKNIVKDLKKETSWATPKTALLVEQMDAAFWKSPDKEKFTEEFCECGGLDLLVSILKKFEEDGLFGAWETAFIIYNCLCNLSEASLLLSTRLASQGMVKLCAHNIVKYREKMNLKDVQVLVRISLSILCNLSTAPTNRMQFREEGVAEKMYPYLTGGGDPFLRTICMITLAYILEEGQEYMLAELDQGTETTEYLVVILRDALKSPDKRYKGLCDREIVQALGRLALHNETNKCKIVEAEGLPLLVEMLKSESAKTQEASANLIRSLAFSDIVRPKLAEHRDCVTVLESASGSSDSDVSNAAKGALWITEAGGVPLLIEMLKSENSHTQQAAANTLRNLAFSDEVRQKLLEDDDCVKVLEMASESTDSSVSDVARGALSVITQGSTSE